MRLRNAVSSAWQQLEAPLSWNLAAEGPEAGRRRVAWAAAGGLGRRRPARDQASELLAAVQGRASRRPYAAEPVSKLAVNARRCKRRRCSACWRWLEHQAHGRGRRARSQMLVASLQRGAASSATSAGSSSTSA
jgi:hypothetical protein